MIPPDTTSASRKRDAVVREYSAIAPVYESRWARYIDASVRATAARINDESVGRFLDVGCGTGVLLQLVSERFRDSTLAGVDLVGPMLRVAQPRLPGALLSQAEAERLPFPEASFDTVLCSNVFHYFRAPGVALGEMRRVLKPGGRLVLTDWCDDYLACRLCDRFLRVFNRAHVRTYRAAELEAMSRQAGFSSVAIDSYKIDWFWGLMTVRAVRN